MRFVFFLVALAIAGCSTQPVTQPVRVGVIEDNAVTVDGVERRWRMFVPEIYKPGVALPLVINFHSTGSTPEAQAEWSEFEVLAQKEGFFVASPEAAFIRKKDGRLTWNATLLANTVDDVAFTEALIAAVSEQYSVDLSRVFASGFSGGARMSSRVACELSDSIAAIGPVAGVRYPTDCAPVRPVPVITFHGKKDRINHYTHQSDSPDYWTMGVEAAVSSWAIQNNCDDNYSEEKISATVTRVVYPGCDSGAEVVFYRSEDAGHTWPGSPIGDRPAMMELAITNPIPATRLIWEFFVNHPMSDVATIRSSKRKSK